MSLVALLLLPHDEAQRAAVVEETLSSHNHGGGGALATVVERPLGLRGNAFGILTPALSKSWETAALKLKTRKDAR